MARFQQNQSLSSHATKLLCNNKNMERIYPITESHVVKHKGRKRNPSFTALIIYTHFYIFC